MNILLFPFSMLLALLSLSGSENGPESLDGTRPQPIVGAIRWDGWVGPLHSAGLEVEHTLGPHQYHQRAPFFSKEIGPDSIQCRGTTQAIMDQEIAYARYAGLDYWAFCWYPPKSGLDTARNLYLASAHQKDIRWCVILGTNPFNYNTDAAWLIRKFKDDNYQKVLNGRPLVYVFPATATTGAELNQLRALSKAAGVPDPYIVAMGFTEKSAGDIADSLHADAISSYASVSRYDTGEPYKGASYSPTVPKSDQAGWMKYAASGKKVVPWMTAGWSPKPRIERSTLWNAYYTTESWAGDGTPEQVAESLQNALDWTKNNARAAEANAILIYAWNEFDEGGWLCPTLGDHTSRIHAVRTILKKNAHD